MRHIYRRPQPAPGIKLFCVIIHLIISVSSVAQAIDPDPGFGVNGQVVLNPGYKSFGVNSGCVQPDGGIIVAGSAIPNTASRPYADFFLTRFKPDGTLDTGFGDNGMVYTDIRGESHDGIVKTIALPGGKIMAAGYSTDHLGTYIALARYTANGKPDSSFNGKGFGRYDNLYGGVVSDMSLQTDGKIVVSVSQPGNGVHLRRFNADGTFDNSFNVQKADEYERFWATSVAVLPDGKVLAAGYTGYYSYYKNGRILVARYQPSGLLDSTFGTNGMVRTQMDSGFAGIVNMTLLPDSSGFYLTISHSNAFLDRGRIVLQRYLANGAPDGGFGANGQLAFTGITSNFEHLDDTRCIIQPDGKLVFAGNTPNDKGVNQFSAIRLNADGSFDNSFGIGGRVTGQPGGTRHESSELFLQADGKIIIAGHSLDSSRDHLAVTRILNSGMVDNNFAFGKPAVLAIPDYGLHREAGGVMCLQQNGKILIAGHADNGRYSNVPLVRLLSDGKIDSTFGVNGIIYSDMTDMPDVYHDQALAWPGPIMAMSTDANDHIFILYGAFNYFSRKYGCTIAKFKPNGSPDSSFGAYGRKDIYVSTGDEQHDYPIGLVLQADGKPVIAVSTTYSNTTLFPDSAYISIVRLNTDGTIDPSFGIGGQVKEKLFEGEYNTTYANNNQPHRLVIQPDGKLLLCGQAKIPAFVRYSIRRYNTNGSIDTQFNNGAPVVTVIEPNSVNIPQGIVLQPDGKILVGGQSSVVGTVMVRYNANGTLDYSFGVNGIAKRIAFGQSGALVDLALQPDGKILMLLDTRHSDAAGTNSNMVLARLLSNGTTDYSFGSMGVKVIAPKYAMEDIAGALALRNDGRILICGTTTTGYDAQYDVYADMIVYGFTNPLIDCSTFTSSAGPDQNICPGGSVTIGTPAVAGVTYVWSPATGLSSTTVAQPVSTPPFTYTYTLKATNQSGCVALDTVTVNVKNLWPPFITPSGTVTICDGSSVQLNITSNATLQWFRNGALIAGANGNVLKVNTPGQYTVRVTDSEGCSVISTITTVQVLPAPPTPVITQNGNILQSSSGTGNQWYLNGVAIAGATAQTYMAITVGAYTVKVTLNNCTSAGSNTINILPTGINSPELDQKIIIAPNPVIDDLHIRYTGNFARFEMAILDMSGQVVWTNGRFTAAYTVDMRAFSAGAYVVRIINTINGQQVHRLIMKK